MLEIVIQGLATVMALISLIVLIALAHSTSASVRHLQAMYLEDRAEVQRLLRCFSTGPCPRCGGVILGDGETSRCQACEPKAICLGCGAQTAEPSRAYCLDCRGRLPQLRRKTEPTSTGVGGQTTSTGFRA